MTAANSQPPKPNKQEKQIVLPVVAGLIWGLVMYVATRQIFLSVVIGWFRADIATLQGIERHSRTKEDSNE